MLTFKNSELAPVINFLTDVPLKGRTSRGRTKLVMVLSLKHQELMEDIEELKKEVGIDESLSDEEQAIPENQEKIENYNREFRQLLSEEASANFDEYSQFLEHLITGLHACEVEFSGQDSLIYDKVLDQLEQEKEGKE
ncbi:DUF1617 family protein [Vagococcus fluvialis]|uniref:DUF1617 family protein n=1 Tax=Vagococcus fluvialis TaxID=2738 RepID=UPI003B59D184